MPSGFRPAAIAIAPGRRVLHVLPMHHALVQPAAVTGGAPPKMIVVLAIDAARPEFAQPIILLWSIAWAPHGGVMLGYEVPRLHHAKQRTRLRTFPPKPVVSNSFFGVMAGAR